MAFWCQIKQSQIKNLSNQFKRCYFQIHGAYSVNHTALLTRMWVLDKPKWVTHKSQFEFCNNVRFFAAPAKVMPKQEEKDTSGPRLNEQIYAQYIRIVTDEGHVIVSRHEALARARRLELDLVEVDRNGKPPVCKLMDYHKEKYINKQKQKERNKSKSEGTLKKGVCKEVRITGKIEQKDLRMKADMVKRLMESGYRVKCMAMGNEDQDLGGLLSRLSALIEDVSLVESGPSVEKKQAYVIVRHAKFGPSKKGSGKKASKAGEATTTQFQQEAVSPPIINSLTQSPLQFEENFDAAESGLETDDDIPSEEAPTFPSLEMAHDLEKNKPTWSVFDASDNFDKVFDFRKDVNGFAKSSARGQMETAPAMSSLPANTFSGVMSTGPILDSKRMPVGSSSPSEAPLGPAVNRYRREPINRFPPTKQTDAKGPARDSMRLEPQFPNQSRRPQFGPSCASSSTSPSYGIYGAPKANQTPGKQSVPAEVNRYKKGAPPSNFNGNGRPYVDESSQGRREIFGTESSNVIQSRNPAHQAKVQR